MGRLLRQASFPSCHLPTPYACTHAIFTHNGLWLYLLEYLVELATLVLVGKAHRALLISGATTLCEHHVATTSLFKHPLACRDKTMWLAPCASTPSRFLSLKLLPTPTTTDRAPGHRGRKGACSSTGSNTVLQVGPTSHRLVLRQSIEAMFVNFDYRWFQHSGRFHSGFWDPSLCASAGSLSDEYPARTVHFATGYVLWSSLYLFFF